MPLWLILVLAILAFLYFFNNRKKEVPPKEQSSPVSKAPKMDLTYEQLGEYTEKTSQFVFVALKGVIYDVSSTEYYKEPSGYAIFAGHDASVNLAKMSHDKSYLNKYGEIPLSPEEKNTLEEWVQRFQQKYPVVGNVILQQK